MKYLSLFLLLGLSACTQVPQNDPNQEEWLQLFNGKDLKGWDLKIRYHELNDNFANTFQVKDSALTVVYDEYEAFNETFGHIFYEQPFSYYRLRTEYRFVGEQVNEGPGWALRNNGLMLHSQSAKSMGLDQDFPISIEVQLLGGNGTDERSTLNLCTPGTNVFMADTLFTNHCISSSSQTYHGDQWVRVEVEVLGDSLVTHLIEGESVLQYTKPQIGGGSVSGHDPAEKQDGKWLSSGYIALQGESHPTQFRKIELLNLKGCMDPKAKNYKAYYVKADNGSCVY